MKVLVLNGIYDLATPFGGTEYTFDHMGLDKKIKGNITQKYYEAGHMMYIRMEDLAKLTRDVREFYAEAVKAKWVYGFRKQGLELGTRR